MSEQQHCEHECVCLGYVQRSECYQADAPCRKPECKHDTRSRPAPSPTAEKKHRTWESCHKHFACPDGEECWYWSSDYYWDCGKGASRLIDARIEAASKAREQVLKPIKDIHERFKHLDAILSKRDPDCPMMMCYVDIWEAVKESLRSTQHQAGDLK